MAADERASAQHRFMEGDADVVVATNAFGMGVDKADVRSVDPLGDPEERRGLLPGGRPRRARRRAAPAAILLAMRADLGRLINFIERDARRGRTTCSRYVRRLRRRRDGDAVVIDAPREDRDRDLPRRSPSAPGCARSSPRRGGRLQVTLRRRARRSAGRRDLPASRATAAGAPTARSRRSSRRRRRCRRRALLDHFGDARAGRAARALLRRVRSRTRSACPTRRRSRPARARAAAQDAAPAGPVDEPLLDALKEWRMRAATASPPTRSRTTARWRRSRRSGPSTLDELAAIKGVGPTFVERHGEQVLALVGSPAAA